MNYRIIIEPTTEREIRSTLRWIGEKQSATAAAKWYNGLIAKTSTLKIQPTRCPLAAENDKFPEEIRGGRRNKYRIVFAIRQDAVHSLYVHHASPDEIEA